MLSREAILHKIQQADSSFKAGNFQDAATLYKEVFADSINHPNQESVDIRIPLAHSLILAADWATINQYLLPGINHLETAGWLQSLKEGKPVNQAMEPLPWITYPAIEFIEDKIQKNFKVFEYGSGNSTLWWSARVEELITLESDMSWFSYVQKTSPANVQARLCQERSQYPQVIYEYPDQYFDVVVIDHLDRNICARCCISKLKEDGIIIFDNSDSHDADEGLSFLASAGFNRIDFHGLIPSYTYKNCTSVLFRGDTALKRGALPSQKVSCLGPSCYQVIDTNSKRQNEVPQPSQVVSKETSEGPGSTIVF